MKKQPWWGIALGLIPALAVLALDYSARSHPVALAVTVIMLLLYAAFSLRDGAVPAWALPGIGVGAPYLLNVAWQQTITEPNANLNALLSTAMLGLFLILLVWGGWLAARRWGALSILLLLPWLFDVYLGVMDPTYAWLMYRPDAEAAARLTEILVRLPVLIVLPVVVLRATAVRKSTLILGLLALELANFAGIPLLIWMQETGTLNAPTVPEGLLRMLTTGQLMIGAMLLPVLGLLVLFAGRGRRQPPAAPMHSARQLAH